ncbi:MAG: putative tricarboxylic transport rane protein [Bacillota bacterium]|nr:putative tricarboxylic transport rane protein [Bacillota bacterium]MDK2855243.1 putative tricarboxylic transport rane protein [Bacillota bacterium]MDK2924446.1 putative tricarboxylic transport rane protein [Bacillota bacterium]
MRKALGLLLVVVLGLGVFGCSKPAGQATEGEKPAAPKYPEKPITFLVPFSAGGGSDIMARAIAGVMQKEGILPQPLVVENKPGGSGSIGYSYVAGKVGDPYIISTVSSSFWTTPLAGNSPVSYKDFTPVAALAMDPFLLMVKEDSPYKTLDDLIKAAKAKPEGLAVGGTSGLSDDRVCTALLEKQAGVKFNFVPFEGGGDAMTALLGGHVQLCWASPGEALNQLEAKKARPLAVSTEERLAKLPDVPTFKELGYDQVVFYQFRGIVAPKNIPEEALKVLEEAFKKLSESPAWEKEYLEPNMVTARYLPAKEFGDAIIKQNELYTQIFKDLGLLK